MNKTCPKCWMLTPYENDICSLCNFNYATGKGGKIADKVLRPPFPYFGSKTKVVHEVWRRFGNVHTYIEPFMGSAAVAINAPYQLNNVILNDLNGFLACFWRAVKAAPEEVARWADWPINEADMHARHRWLLRQDFRQKLDDDPDWYDAKIAGWWAWGQSIWIGGGWCSQGHEHENSRPILTKNGGTGGKQSSHVRRERPTLNCTRGLLGQKPLLHHDYGINAQGKRPMLGRVNGVNGHGKKPFAQHNLGVNSQADRLTERFRLLQAKLRSAKVCCGDWSRVVTPVCWGDRGPTAIFLDPPYSHKDRNPTLYGGYDSLQVAKHVRNWAIAHGDNPTLRIAVCGYEGEHDFPSSWSCYSWVGKRGYTKDGRNKEKERIWFNKSCII